jgi:formyl transferase-like protein
VSGRRVGLLSCRNHPLLPSLLERVQALPDVDLFLILDERPLSARQRRLIEERTQGAFAGRDGPRPAIREIAVPDHNSPECVAAVARERLELLVNAGTPRILGAPLLASAPRGVLNVHPGLLPAYRGASCCEWAILNGDPVGVTAHFMDEAIDQGPILLLRELAVERGWTYPRLRTALYELAQAVCAEGVARILDCDLRPAQLPRQGDGRTWAPMPPEIFARVVQKLADGGYPGPSA